MFGSIQEPGLRATLPSPRCRAELLAVLSCKVVQSGYSVRAAEFFFVVGDESQSGGEGVGAAIQRSLLPIISPFRSRSARIALRLFPATGARSRLGRCK